jgi:GH35 family endo-1,4-beta-xylanase
MLSGLYLPDRPELGERKMVKVEGMPFTEALELRTRQKTPNPWDFQLSGKIPAVIHKGDAIWTTLWLRATETSSESHEGFTELSIEENHEPFDKIGLFEYAASSEWKQFAWSSTAPRDYAAGEAQICLRAGYAPQVIQIGGLQVLDFGNTVRATDLPRSKITYPGMEADAPWRKAAAERIEKYRKGDIRVTVTGPGGKPLAGATVRIEQKRHAFGFGSCVVASLIEGTGPDNDHYRDVIKSSYSKVVMENDLKWGPWDGTAGDGHKTTLAALQWLRDQGIAVRGHNLVWPSWRFSPEGLAADKNDPKALEQHIEDHLRDEVTATKGLLTEWDVVNEPFANHDLLDLLPPDAMAGWFKLVHQLDPKPVLYLNDYAGLTNKGENTPHKDAFEKLLRQLKEQGAPIGGLGIQAHLGQELTGPEQIVSELDRWARLGLDIEVTEFDLDFEDEKVQAQYTRDFMTAVFSHPAVTALLSWGFWQDAHWKPSAAYYRSDWSVKPNGEAWNDLVLKEWHTDSTAKTDAAGTVSTRGFLGQYEVTVTDHGVSKTWPLTVGKDGAVLNASLP